MRIAKSEDRRIEDLVDPTQLAGIEDDPRALGRLMRKMGQEMGEDTGPEFDEVVSRLEKGEDPEQIERDMPDLGEGSFDFDDYQRSSSFNRSLKEVTQEMALRKSAN